MEETPARAATIEERLKVDLVVGESELVVEFDIGLLEKDFNVPILPDVTNACLDAPPGPTPDPVRGMIIGKAGKRQDWRRHDAEPRKQRYLEEEWHEQEGKVNAVPLVLDAI